MVKDGFKPDFTAEQFLVNVRSPVFDMVDRDALNDYPENVRKAWTAIHDSLDSVKAAPKSVGAKVE
jgi:hypothetical protein